MEENKTIEQYKAAENELKRQLEEAKAANEKLELELKYKDKTTGFWNRKYAEKLIEENSVGADAPDFTIVFTDFEDLNSAKDKSGSISDTLLESMAYGLKSTFGNDAIYCKYAGAKMCVFLKASSQLLEEKLKLLDEFIAKFKGDNNSVTVSYGYASHTDHPDADANVLLNEAEYSMQMRKAAQEGETAKSPVSIAQSAHTGLVTILMIDDSLFNLRNIQMMLKDRYKLLMATDGIEGYEIAKAKKPDLILLDYNMPLIDGERTLHLLKKSNLTADIPVIFISGVSDKEKIMKVANLKPAGYLLKPVEKDNLLFTISSVLNP